MDLLQNFSKETSQPATVFTCFQCDRVRSRRNIESIKRCEARDKIDYTYKREDAFWRCINCKNEQISQYKDEGPWIHMTTVNVENRKISKPITEEGETRTDRKEIIGEQKTLSGIEEVRMNSKPKGKNIIGGKDPIRHAKRSKIGRKDPIEPEQRYSKPKTKNKIPEIFN